MSLLKINSLNNISIYYSDLLGLTPANKKGCSIKELNLGNLNKIDDLTQRTEQPFFEFCSTDMEIRPEINRLLLLEGMGSHLYRFYNPNSRFVPLYMFWDYGNIPLTMSFGKEGIRPFEFGRNNTRMLSTPEIIANKQKIRGAFNLVIFVLEIGLGKDSSTEQLTSLKQIVNYSDLELLINDFSERRSLNTLKKINDRISILKSEIDSRASIRKKVPTVFLQATFCAEILNAQQSFSCKRKELAQMNFAFN